MVEKKTVGISALSAILGMLLMLGGIQLTDDNVYYCEDRAIIMQCDSLSQYYGLENGKCWNAEIGNKLCRTGWVEVVNDIQPVDEVEQSITRLGIKEICDNNGCKPLEEKDGNN